MVPRRQHPRRYIGERSAPPLPVDLQKDVVFGVKTTAKFHDDRARGHAATLTRSIANDSLNNIYTL